MKMAARRKKKKNVRAPVSVRKTRGRKKKRNEYKAIIEIDPLDLLEEYSKQTASYGPYRPLGRTGRGIVKFFFVLALVAPISALLWLPWPQRVLPEFIILYSLLLAIILPVLPNLLRS
ncbi:hypothetical protein [Thermococcus sp. MAR1]|uniref:hypothetical protein n=1 Tax=Thermococcus sp. MAR1 TaxID=1638263 RepID=UPI00143AC62E|nr:hypothetical protein [Thermococcus sp. MAR1]NJE09335.1 hypothetical protein [Thermococcus sp. MAR1]